LHSNPKYKEQEETDVLDSSGFVLVVWNDEVNTFEWVIKTLIEVCGHEQEQAEQCAMIVHYTGKCSVKSGSYEGLVDYRDALIDRELNVTIE